MFLIFLYYALPILLEPFPISSSGNVLLLERILTKFQSAFIYDMPSYYAYFSHGPIALIVLLFFWRSWLEILCNSTRQQLQTIFVAGFIADLITVIFYGFFSCCDLEFFPLWLGFFITSCLLFSLKFCHVKHMEHSLTIRAGLFLGVAQGIALLPGISRFGTTFVVARWLGFSDRSSFIYSFLIEWPISIAGFFKGIYSLYQVQDNHSEVLNLQICLFILIAMFGAYFGFYRVEQIIKKKKLWIFSYYVFAVFIISLMLNV